METKMIIKIVVACGALVINLVLLGFVIWSAKRSEEVVFWPMIVSWIVTIVNAVIQIML